ncbi:GntP family permease [Haliea sp. AH-315-K21]|uniref:Gluconate transporter n=1 Tax=SAR86 cluster bacterium TaxID=2030880 RepID=A0A2A5CA43_9GAMM|nr:GntP family permease [Haliea sp. AH-315-K21]PCJ40236.1 MAG: gluconate transporter [SAR86 cluster bacterium]
MIIFLWLLITVAVIVWLTIKFQLHPFLGLLFGALFIGFVGGLTPANLMNSLADGFGATLRSIGIVIAAGAIIGEYLDRSGGAKVLANKILDSVGEKHAPLSIGLTGYIVSIPVFCDSGFIVLSALNKAISKRANIPLAVLTVSLASGLYATHVFVPPTPGPLAAAATLGADIGWVLILGIVVSIPVMLVAILWASKGCSHYVIEFELSEEAENQQTPPSFALAIMPILLPIVLIAIKSIAQLPSSPLGENGIFNFFVFIGDPIIALLIGAVLSFLMVRSGKKIQHLWLEEALKKAGLIILITGAGGAFGAVLRETNLSEIASNFVDLGAFGMLIPFLIAAFLKTAQGSSTVAIITTAAIMVPLMTALGFDSTLGKALVVLVIGAGSITVSHVNDSYFWVIAKFSNMDTATALKTHTIASMIMGFTGLLIVQILALVLL